MGHGLRNPCCKHFALQGKRRCVMIALVLELCGGVCALSTIVFLAVALVRKLMPDFEEELGADLERSQAERFVSHLEQSGFIVMRRPIPNHGAGDNPGLRGFEG
jgi:hypothetical protein